MKKLLIFTGPQGSGNHMWSKVVSSNPNVNGWKELTEKYWVTHANEPFNKFWLDPTLLSSQEFEDGLYYTSISCPFISKGGPDMTDIEGHVPNYRKFIESAKEYGFEITLGIIGRDPSILEVQQLRVRKKKTTYRFLDQISNQGLLDYNPVFVSTELLYLYKNLYLKQLAKQLDFPIDNIDTEVLDKILADNTNAKYIKPVESYWLDRVMADDAKQHEEMTNKNE